MDAASAEWAAPAWGRPEQGVCSAMTDEDRRAEYRAYRKGVQDAFRSLGERLDERVMILIRAESTRLGLTPTVPTSYGECVCCHPDCIDPKCQCPGGALHPPAHIFTLRGRVIPREP
jgi:hypothetical protein